MIGAAPLRRLTIFGIVFGGIMAVVVWSAGGVTSGHEGPVMDPSRRTEGEGPVVPIHPGAHLGSGSGVRVERDGVEVVDGRPLPYRAFEATWERQAPQPGSSSEQRRLRTEDFSLLFFHARPTAEEPRPRAVEGPDTTRVTAREAELSIRDGEEFRADLVGDVVVTRHATAGDLTLRSERLFCDAETREASTDERVIVEGRGARIEGTGLDADLDTPRALLQSNVSGTFLARPGALTGEGGLAGEDPLPTTVTCSGTAEVRALGKEQRRWRAEFRDDVVVAQAGRTLRCNHLEIEFRLARGARDGVEILRSLADGQVIAEGPRDDGTSTYSIRSASAETTRDRKGGYDVTFLGGTEAVFAGALRDEGEGRVVVRCDGPAVFHTDATPTQPGEPIRGRASFRDGVVAQQWDAATGEIETEIRAPEVTLFGGRDMATPADAGRLRPETLTATGTADERVHLRRRTLEAQSATITWTVHAEHGVERLLLTGTPTASFEDTGGMNLTGSGQAGVPGRLLLTANDEIQATYYREEGAAADQPLAEFSATGGVVARRIVGERETYRMSSRSADVRVAQDRQPAAVRAHGNVVVTGRGERPGDRLVTLRGDRLSARRHLPQPDAGQPGPDPSTTDPWTRTDVFVFGEPRRPASTVIEEPARDGRAARVHELHAVELRYEESGTVIVARRGARALINRAATDDATSPLSGEISILGTEIRARLRGADDPAGGRGADDLLGVSATGGATLESRRTVVTGSEMEYDHERGFAVVTGKPARAVLRTETPTDVAFDSFVHSDRIEVQLDAAAAGRKREVSRITCQGGRIVRYIFDDPTAETPHPLPERLSIDAQGPIQLEPGGGRAMGNVRMRWESLGAGTRWTQDAELTCERVNLTFDPVAEGRLQDRVTYAIARGTEERPVVVTSAKGLRATADRVEVRGSWLLLRSRAGTPVHVVERERAREFECGQGDWNYRTREWRDFSRFRLR